jgi:hypothetical protein
MRDLCAFRSYILLTRGKVNKNWFAPQAKVFFVLDQYDAALQAMNIHACRAICVILFLGRVADIASAIVTCQFEFGVVHMFIVAPRAWCVNP